MRASLVPAYRREASLYASLEGCDRFQREHKSVIQEARA